MTEPTKEELLSLAAKYDGRAFMLSRTTGAQLEVRDYRIVAECLRLAANLPSESEIERIIDKYVFESGEGELQRADEAAARILKRIRSVK